MYFQMFTLSEGDLDSKRREKERRKEKGIEVLSNLRILVSVNVLFRTGISKQFLFVSVIAEFLPISFFSYQ